LITNIGVIMDVRYWHYIYIYFITNISIIMGVTILTAHLRLIDNQYWCHHGHCNIDNTLAFR